MKTSTDRHATKPSRWGKTPRRGMRRIAVTLLVALLPVACASHEAPRNGAPATPGQSQAGNYLAGRHAQAEREIGAAVRFLNAALEKDPDNTELLRRTFMLMAIDGHFDKAVALAKRLDGEKNKSSIAAMVLVIADIRDKRFDAADERLRGLPAAEGLNVFMVPLLRAWSLVGQGDIDAALKALAPLAANKGFTAMREMHHGLINEVAGRNDAAVQHYLNTVTSRNGLSLRLVEILGALYERMGQADKARALYHKYADEHPTSPLIGPALARLQAGSASKQPVRSAAEGAAEALFGVSNSVRQRSTQDAALLFGRMALILKPNFPLAQILIADILETDNRLAMANDVYRAIDPASPFAWSARLSIAANLNRMERTDEAVDQLRAMAKENPAQPESLINLGDILRGHERFDEAIAAYDQAFARIDKLQPQHWTLLYARGIALERAKDWKRAETDFLKALEFEPDQPYVLNYLGYSWIDQGRNLERARGMIEKAVKLRPNDGFIVDSMGWILYRLGDYAGAARELERAVELRPQDAVINDHLGDAYWRVGRHAEARFQWRRAFSLEPDEALRDTLKTKIEKGLAAVTTEKAAADD